MSGLRAFIHYNRYKQSIMLQNDPAGARVILRLLPLCIHMNHPDLPGYVGDEDCPCGIRSMEWAPDTVEILESYLGIHATLKDLQEYIPRHREIEGLFTIGSVGSVGQTRHSDYDLWVVVDKTAIGPSRLAKLENKLRKLEKWITSRYLLEVHFFPMDVVDIRANNFGEVSQEGAGSALKYTLKEEFYRTMTLLEGRVPLWWIVPPGASDEDYFGALRKLPRLEGMHPDDFIDLGNIQAIPEQEFLGAALWQMHKALDDPLKSVIKMALLATYLEDQDRPPLCDLIKKQVLKARRGTVVDPYIETFRCVEQFYARRNETQIVELLRRCFYLKVAPRIQTEDLLRVGDQDKSAIMVGVVGSWGWSLREIKRLNEFQNWGIDLYREFGEEIHGYLRNTSARLIRQSKAHLLKSSTDQDVEMEVLRRRIEVVYLDREGKVNCERRVMKNEPAYDELYFAYDGTRWHIYDQSPGRSERQPVMSRERVVELLAWLAYNRRTSPSTSLHMIPNASHVVLADLQTLLQELNKLLPGSSGIDLDRVALMKPGYARRLILVGNMEAPPGAQSVQQVDVISVTSWHEVFCHHLPLKEFRPWFKERRRSETELNIWLPGEGDSRRLARSLISLIS